MVNVVFHTAFIGDLILAIPLIQNIKRVYAHEPLILVCKPGLKDFFLSNKLVDEVIELDKKKSESKKIFLNKIKSYQIHNLFCVHQSLHSAWLLKGVTAQNKISYKQFWNAPFFNQRIVRRMRGPEPARALDLLGAVDAQTKEFMDQFFSNEDMLNTHKQGSLYEWPARVPPQLQIQLSADSNLLQQLVTQWNLKKPYVVLAPSSQWKTKRWTEKGFVDLSHWLRQHKLNVYLVGAPAEKEQCEKIASESRETSLSAEIRSLAGQTNLVQLQSLLGGAEYVVTNDSGPMHLAAAVGRPVISIFGPTTLALGYRPWSDRSVVVQKDLSCRPCGKHGHNECPLKTHDCMRQILVTDVVQAIEHLRM